MAESPPPRMTILNAIILLQYADAIPIERPQTAFRLPHPNMVLDPRPNNPRDCQVEISYNDNLVTLILTEAANNIADYAYFEFEFRAYDRNVAPSFDSSIYTYTGVPGEKAPFQTRTLLIDSNVTEIWPKAFEDCSRIRSCEMGVGVIKIGHRAFHRCDSMKNIKLSPSLRQIESEAFLECTSIEALFVPPTIQSVAEGAFNHCRNIRILPLPPNVTISPPGKKILHGCDAFFETTQLQKYESDDDQNPGNIDAVHGSVVNFYNDYGDYFPFHKACLGTGLNEERIFELWSMHDNAAVTAQDHDGMTPLHILAMNFNADVTAILACLKINNESASIMDKRGQRAIDYLEDNRFDAHNALRLHSSTLL